MNEHVNVSMFGNIPGKGLFYVNLYSLTGDRLNAQTFIVVAKDDRQARREASRLLRAGANQRWNRGSVSYAEIQYLGTVDNL